MKERCRNPNCAQFSDYGGRGIEVCDRWKNSFDNFHQDMGDKPDGLTIERIDNDGNYSPENCKWATRKEQRRNQRNVHLITHQGITLCLSDWSIKTGVHRITLTKRIKNGWPLERALFCGAKRPKGK